MSQKHWIRESRKAAGWSQADLGKKLAVSQVQVSLWETSKGVPTGEQETALRDLLGGASPAAPTPSSARSQGF